MNSDVTYRPFPVQGAVTINARLRSINSAINGTRTPTGCRDYDAMFALATDNKPQELAQCDPIVFASGRLPEVAPGDVKIDQIRFIGVTAAAVAPGAGGRIANVAVLVSGSCNVRNTSIHEVEIGDVIGAYCGIGNNDTATSCFVGSVSRVNSYQACLLRNIGIAISSAEKDEVFGIVLTPTC